VPQLDDNVRLTIDEYRSKLYQLIKNTDYQKKDSQQQQQQQQQQHAYSQAKEATVIKAAKSKANYSNELYNENSSINQKKSTSGAANYSSPYNTYDSKSKDDMMNYSDSNSLTPTPPTPPPAHQHHMSAAAAATASHSHGVGGGYQADGFVDSTSSLGMSSGNAFLYENANNANRKKTANYDLQYTNSLLKNNNSSSNMSGSYSGKP
jgi:hypothetical protein